MDFAAGVASLAWNQRGVTRRSTRGGSRRRLPNNCHAVRGGGFGECGVLGYEGQAKHVGGGEYVPVARVAI